MTRLFTTLLALTASLGGAHAAPATEHHHGDTPSCIDTTNAALLAENWGWMVASWTLNVTKSRELLLSSIAEVGFTDYSDSIRDVESLGCTNGPEPLDDSREAFEADQQVLPPFVFNVQKVWHSCDTVTFLWESPATKETGQRSRGIVLLEVVESTVGPAPRSPTHVIQTAYSEFNTVPFLVNGGVFVPKNCSAAAPTIPN
ncbi:uncharacterized protein C8A04DRAFT_32232 [Dichotomopilus funicola]|uniref:NTF2-like domain-containing protein n=1 Tax=Dichotomopilus funicola TaxID=1934379 RepID=A0AAN6ZJV7_9PEZI|nr:hypothetical protein C8A04DRAFT_32232 [Dichotomopilus funicola]